MASYLDGVEALYQLLDGLVVLDEDDQPVTSDGQQVPPATTYLVLPADLALQGAQGKVLIHLSRAGWSDDDKETEGHDRVAVEVYGPDRPVVAAVSQGIEDMLVDDYHDVPGVGFIDDVRRDARWRIVPEPTDGYVKSSATYRLISRPD